MAVEANTVQRSATQSHAGGQESVRGCVAFQSRACGIGDCCGVGVCRGGACSVVVVVGWSDGESEEEDDRPCRTVTEARGT